MSKIVSDLYSEQKYDVDSSEYYTPTARLGTSDDLLTIPTVSEDEEDESPRPRNQEMLTTKKTFLEANPDADSPNDRIKPWVNNSDDDIELHKPVQYEETVFNPALDVMPLTDAKNEAEAKAKATRAALFIQKYGKIAYKMKNSKEKYMKRKPKKEQLYYLYKLAVNRRYL